MSMWARPWDVSDGLWERLEPLLPKKPRRFRYPGRKPFDDRLALQGILFVLHTGIGWEHLPQELGFGCGVTAWRGVRALQPAGVWGRLAQVVFASVRAGRGRGATETTSPSCWSCSTAYRRFVAASAGPDDAPTASSLTEPTTTTSTADSSGSEGSSP